MTEQYPGPERRRTDQRAVLLAAATELREGMHELAGKFDRVQTFSNETRKIAHETDKANRRLKWMVAFMAVVLVALVVLFVRQGNNIERSNAALSIAEQNKRAAHAVCESDNTERELTRTVFTKILVQAYSPGTSWQPTEKDRKDLKNFLALLNKAYMPRDCAAPPPTPTPELEPSES